MRKILNALRFLYCEQEKLMADVTQLQTDVAALQQAIADDQTAIAAVQAYVASEQTSIAQLTAEVAALQNQVPNLDLSGLESAIATMKQQNATLAAVVPVAPVVPAA